MGFSRNVGAYFSDAPIDGTATGVSSVDTVLTGYPPFHTIAASVVIDNAENILTPAVISIGTNHPNYNNIVNAKAVGSAVGLKILELAPNAPAIPPETEIKVKVNAAAIPIPALTATLDFKVALIGYDVEF